MDETQYLLMSGTLVVIEQREQDNSGWTNIDDIDWNQL